MAVSTLQTMEFDPTIRSNEHATNRCEPLVLTPRAFSTRTPTLLAQRSDRYVHPERKRLTAIRVFGFAIRLRVAPAGSRLDLEPLLARPREQVRSQRLLPDVGLEVLATHEQDDSTVDRIEQEVVARATCRLPRKLLGPGVPQAIGLLHTVTPPGRHPRGTPANPLSAEHNPWQTPAPGTVIVAPPDPRPSAGRDARRRSRRTARAPFRHRWRARRSLARPVSTRPGSRLRAHR